ncbi:DUF4335 domain-containing protein [Sphaerothrix gracilis]|uniref:DUF4335 domain-containing protein n=1 Tax=Sphaerothrix gracilis TaxID=3151835 RepID=UPI0031FE09A1
MTIQRQYTLPNCNLILEGLSTQTGGDFAETMDVLVSAECHLGNSAQVLKGDRAFFQSLVSSVNQYGQELLSGLPHRAAANGTAPAVTLQQGEGPYHHLFVRSPEDSSAAEVAGSGGATEIKLTTVQLFDLIEAIDQFLADSQTLPEVGLSIPSLPRRYAKADKPVTQRALPAALGASTLAAAAVALFFIPVPDFAPPERPVTETEEPTSEDEPIAEDSLAEPIEPVESDNAIPADVVAAAAALDDRVEASPEITDSEQVADLQQQLSASLQELLAENPEFEQELVYRVAVSEEGDLIGYKYVNDAALLNVDATPLPTLTYIALDEELVQQEPVAQFRVTFTPQGELDVEPWQQADSAAESDEVQTAATAIAPDELPEGIENEIVTGILIEDLNQRLYRALRADDAPEADGDLTYRVRLNEAGDVVGYEALDAASRRSSAETPLPELVAADEDPSAPQADFRVVFTESGVLEVNPWKGWPR